MFPNVRTILNVVVQILVNKQKYKKDIAINILYMSHDTLDVEHK